MANELVITRLFNAPRKVVWQAWTTPELMMQWWGPRYFTIPVAEMDVRVGGKYLLCMRSADGQDFWSTGTYKEIVPEVKLVCTDSFADEEGNIVSGDAYGIEGMPLELEVVITFEEIAGQTRMILRHSGVPEEMQQLCAQSWNESFDKLAELVA